MTNFAAKLSNRSILRLSGSDTKSFLQGILTQDIETLSADKPIYAGLLTPQGKFLFEMIISLSDDAYFLDIELDLKDELIRRLMMYRLRADVEIVDESNNLSVWATWGKTPIGLPDPRSDKVGKRIILDAGKEPAAEIVAFEEYDKNRIQAGLPDGSRDILRDKYFWLETNAEALNGVSFTKGCYVGQEQNNRMKNRTTIKKCLLPISIEGGAPDSGTEILTTEGKKAGTVHSSQGDIAMAYIRLEHKDADLLSDGRKTVLL